MYSDAEVKEIIKWLKDTPLLYLLLTHPNEQEHASKLDLAAKMLESQNKELMQVKASVHQVLSGLAKLKSIVV